MVVAISTTKIVAVIRKEVDQEDLKYINTECAEGVFIQVYELQRVDDESYRFDQGKEFPIHDA
jgi:hypothetical protein